MGTFIKQSFIFINKEECSEVDEILPTGPSKLEEGDECLYEISKNPL